ncbi:type VII secretion protein EccB [Actinoplanes utahensis]|uniref:Type VII secretion protein EccB n=1 Tax=Actinoplanes utahensis TaxID=1869 RepID=A0A0A6UMC4_ACTUT|nr:type VII secretion protein EccB [Actinoplanes utahensis]KHD76586.1 hypothetical protein MB27_16445 [Actinoplanes utahensis]GIF31279.1 ESX-3 secretion system protein eccB3 [Actinoplanes utahensis]
MISRRDQLQSYQFMNQRVISALVMRETDPAQSPLRRGIGALFGGIMIAVLVAAGFGVYGLLTRTGANQWQQEGAVVVERESGASFVYRGRRLLPAVNFASAKLAAGRPNPPVFRIAAKSLTGTPRGNVIGIAGAPASLPDPARQLRLPWAMCAVPGNDPKAVLVVGAGGPPGKVLDASALVADDDPGTAGSHLIWKGRKHAIPQTATFNALFGQNRQPVRVAPAWLNTLPAGADITAVPVADPGGESGAAPGFDNGDVLVSRPASGAEFHIVLDDGVASITELQQAIQTGLTGERPREISLNDLGALPVSRALGDGGGDAAGPPKVPPLENAASGDAVCAVTADAGAPPRVGIATGGAGSFGAAIPTPGNNGGGRALASSVQVGAGGFALVRVPGSGSLVLVTDVALAHPLADEAAVQALGYDPAAATSVPTALINAIPEGVTLDPRAAAQAADRTPP